MKTVYVCTKYVADVSDLRYIIKIFLNRVVIIKNRSKP